MNPRLSCCDDINKRGLDRRVFLERAGKVALVGGAALATPLGLAF